MICALSVRWHWLDSLESRAYTLPRMLPELVFFLALFFVVTPYSSPPIALAIGLAFGVFLRHPYSKQTKSFSKTLLQVCVVGLGFGMNLQQVIRAGRSGFIYT